MSGNLQLVSIITPCLNAQNFVRETIESVLTQDYEYFEHILIDGGSQDGTIEILQQYPNLLWTTEPDSGQSHAINKGFRKARGEIFGWLNADDTYNPGAITFAVNYFYDHPGIDLIFGDVQIIDGKSNPLEVKKGKTFQINELLINNYVRQPTVFFRRYILDEIGGLDENLHYCMDREFWLRVATKFQVQYVPGQPRANFRICEGTKTFLNIERFQAEWHSVLENSISNPRYQGIPLSLKQFAIQKYQVDYRVASIRKAWPKQDWKAIIHHTTSMGKENWRYVLNYPFVKIKSVLKR